MTDVATEGRMKLFDREQIASWGKLNVLFHNAVRDCDLALALDEEIVL